CSLKFCMEEISKYLKGWFGYFRLCTKMAIRSFQTFDAHIRRRLRAIIIRQKKNNRILFRHLLKKGLKEPLAARTAFRRCGTWPKSITDGMHKAYPVAWFKEEGLTFLADILQVKLRMACESKCGEVR